MAALALCDPPYSFAAAAEQLDVSAGGAAGLLVVPGDSAEEVTLWRTLLQHTESRGFGGLLSGAPGAVEYLRSLGAQRVCALAAGAQAQRALRLSANTDGSAFIATLPTLRAEE